MRFALVDGHRCEAAPGVTGVCQACGAPTIAKCGNLRTWHWAHKNKRMCDSWWEETEWHIAWKNHFPPDCQEILYKSPDGEVHIADVKLPDGRTLEFQHSPISEIERRSREDFYGSMIWIVDGLRRKRDRENFKKTIHMVSREPLVYSGFESECALLRDWVGRPVDVIFDFGSHDEDVTFFGKSVLWQLHPDNKRRVILSPIYTEAFIELLNKGGALQRISYTFAPPTPPAPHHHDSRLFRPESFSQYHRWISRRRFRF